MRFALILTLFVCALWANVFTPEYYKNQIEVLRKLDIESNYISDLVFVESKSNIKRVHSKTLSVSASEFYEFIPSIRKIIKENDLPKEFLYLPSWSQGLKCKALRGCEPQAFGSLWSARQGALICVSMSLSMSAKTPLNQR